MLCYSNVEGFGLEAEARMTTWHVMMPSENEADTQQSQDVSEGTNLSAYFSLILKACHGIFYILLSHHVSAVY